jgi:hypothetical protein
MYMDCSKSNSNGQFERDKLSSNFTYTLSVSAKGYMLNSHNEIKPGKGAGCDIALDMLDSYISG